MDIYFHNYWCAKQQLKDTILKILIISVKPEIMVPNAWANTSICVHNGCRARDPHFQPWISIPKHMIQNYQKIRSGASPFSSFFCCCCCCCCCGFCRSGDHNFQISFNINPFIASHSRLSPNAKHSAAPRRPGSSGELHFHAQNGPSSFQNPLFSRSKRLKLVLEPRIFTLDRSSFRSPGPFFTLPRHMPSKIWGEYPPPPPRPIQIGLLPDCVFLPSCWVCIVLFQVCETSQGL